MKRLMIAFLALLCVLTACKPSSQSPGIPPLFLSDANAPVTYQQDTIADIFVEESTGEDGGWRSYRVGSGNFTGEGFRLYASAMKGGDQKAVMAALKQEDYAGMVQLLKDYDAVRWHGLAGAASEEDKGYTFVLELSDGRRLGFQDLAEPPEDYQKFLTEFTALAEKCIDYMGEPFQEVTLYRQIQFPGANIQGRPNCSYNLTFYQEEPILSKIIGYTTGQTPSCFRTLRMGRVDKGGLDSFLSVVKESDLLGGIAGVASENDKETALWTNFTIKIPESEYMLYGKNHVSEKDAAAIHAFEQMAAASAAYHQPTQNLAQELEQVAFQYTLRETDRNQATSDVKTLIYTIDISGGQAWLTRKIKLIKKDKTTEDKMLLSQADFDFIMDALEANSLARWDETERMDVVEAGHDDYLALDLQFRDGTTILSSGGFELWPAMLQIEDKYRELEQRTFANETAWKGIE